MIVGAEDRARLAAVVGTACTNTSSGLGLLFFGASIAGCRGGAPGGHEPAGDLALATEVCRRRRGRPAARPPGKPPLPVSTVAKVLTLTCRGAARRNQPAGPAWQWRRRSASAGATHLAGVSPAAAPILNLLDEDRVVRAREGAPSCRAGSPSAASATGSRFVPRFDHRPLIRHIACIRSPSSRYFARVISVHMLCSSQIYKLWQRC